MSALLRGRQCRFQWGDQGASWDRLVRDALLLQLREERERLQAATAAQDDRSSSYADGQTNRPFAPFTGELEGQLADCEAEMKEVLQGPSRPVSATALTARLLREQLPLAPVTLHAAARAAPPWQPNNGIGDGVRRGQVIDHLCGQQDLKGSLIGGFVRFQQSLPASPSLIHITAIRPVWTIRIKELSERGMLLQILPMTPGTGWKDAAHADSCCSLPLMLLHAAALGCWLRYRSVPARTTSSSLTVPGPRRACCTWGPAKEAAACRREPQSLVESAGIRRLF